MALLLSLVPAAREAETCADTHPSCQQWALKGECARNPAFMASSCALSCQSRIAQPELDGCTDSKPECAAWESAGECEKNRAFMHSSCQLSCGVCCANRIKGCRAFAESGRCVLARRFMSTYCCEECGDASLCADAVPDCEAWAAAGGCSNEGSAGQAVRAECPLSCKECEPAALPHTEAVTGWHEHEQPTPVLLFGTAWKGGRTRDAVLRALRLGYRAIDTACQPKHYNEAGVGEALAAIESEGVGRDQIFLQTKFTPPSAQDVDKMPYEVEAPLALQVAQSINASFANLRTSYIDSLLLHTPLPTHAETMVAWAALEKAVDDGRVRALGVSNVEDVTTFAKLYQDASIKPSWLQNAFWPRSRHDKALRAFCQVASVRYQGYRLIAGNRVALESDLVRELARQTSVSAAQAWFATIRALGVVGITGSSSESHLQEALRGTATQRDHAAQAIELERWLDSAALSE